MEVGPADKLCRHIERRGFCLYQDKCLFRHVPTPAEEAALALRRNPPGNVGGLRDSEEVGAAGPRVRRKRRNNRNKKRASVFRRFLLDVFGQERLSSGPILDVAGGKGELSFELCNLNNCEAIVIEPKEVDFTKWVRAYTKGLYHCTEPLQHYNVSGYDPDAIILPQHVRAFWVPFWRPEVGSSASDAWERAHQCAVAVKWEEGEDPQPADGPVDSDHSEQKRGVGHGGKRGYRHGEDGLCEPIRWALQATRSLGIETEEHTVRCLQLEDGKASSWDWLIRKACQSSLLTGLHADQPTEWLVDFALRHHKPFAVVPCCVFPEHFPQRRLHNGQKVIKHEAFVDYLIQKAAGWPTYPWPVRTATLGFEGRNTVVYSDVGGRGWAGQTPLTCTARNMPP